MGRPKGSKNKKKVSEETNSIASGAGTLEHKENKTELEHNIVIHKKNAERRVRTGKAPKVTNLIKDYSTQDEPRGSPTGKCQECGKIFEQELSERRNAYQSYKICPDCRKKRAVKQEEQFAKDMEDNVFEAGAPYQPYPWQIEAAEAFEHHRFIVLACGNRCFLKGAFINGADKLVEELTEDDFVIDKNGNFQGIIEIQIQPYESDVYTLKGVGLEPLELSEHHKIWITTIKNNTKEIVKQEFIEIKELQSYIANVGQECKVYLEMPKIKSNIECDYWKFEELKGAKGQMKGIPINEDTAWMLGLYCAEGCYLGNAGCKWTLNYKEPELANKLCNILDSLELHYNVREREDSGTRCVVVTKMQFCRKIDYEVGHGSTNKKIPRSIMYNKNRNILLAFMKGYYDGDGSYKNEIGVLENTTVSKILSQQLQSAWTSFGVFAKIHSYQRKRTRLRKGGTIGKQSREYSLHINETIAAKMMGYEAKEKVNKNNVKCVKYDNAIYTPITEITVKKRNTEIYAITTEDGTIVSNCIRISNSGKDRMTIMTGIKYFVECLNENRLKNDPTMVPSVLWWQLAPTEKMAKQNWRELLTYFPKEWIVACSSSDYQMETVGGGIIEVRSGYDPDALVGVGLDLVTITEAARFKDLHLAWANVEARLNSEGRGRKIDRMGSRAGKGKAIINSSPLGKNDFYDLWCYGQKNHDNYDSDWWSAQYPWTCNPSNQEAADEIKHTRYGDMRKEDILRRQLGERLFRSNYLADFLAEDGSVFKSFDEKCVVNLYAEKMTQEERQEFVRKWKEVELGAEYIAGYDPATGSSGDSPALVIRNKNTNRVVQAYDLYGKNYEQQYDFIANICKTYNYAEIHWLRTGHTAIEGQFERRGIREVPIDEQGSKKGQLVQTLELAVENGDLQVLNDGTDTISTLIFQMNDYTEKNGKYSNNKVPHDDFVSALYAAFSDYSVSMIPIAYCGMIGGV